MKGLTCTALTGVGELKALVRVGSVGVELQPQVVGGAVQDEPHQLVPSEGTQGPRGVKDPFEVPEVRCD